MHNDPSAPGALTPAHFLVRLCSTIQGRIRVVKIRLGAEAKVKKTTFKSCVLPTDEEDLKNAEVKDGNMPFQRRQDV